LFESSVVEDVESGLDYDKGGLRLLLVADVAVRVVFESCAHAELARLPPSLPLASQDTHLLCGILAGS
jgi:hypothetical protein